MQLGVGEGGEVGERKSGKTHTIQMSLEFSIEQHTEPTLTADKRPVSYKLPCSPVRVSLPGRPWKHLSLTSGHVCGVFRQAD